MAAVEPMEVYGVFAHGCDLLDEGRKIIPDDCIYVTYELCGVNTIHYNKLMYAFMDPRIRGALNDPIRHEAVLKDYFGSEYVHVHPPGSTYIDSEYTGVLNMGRGEYDLVYKSGLYQIDNYRPYDKITLTNLDLTLDETYMHPLFNIIDENQPITQEIYDSIFSGSMIETRPPYVPGSDLRGYANDDNSKWRLSSAFLIYPGIYYNFVCRGDCTWGPASENWKNRVKLQREISHPGEDFSSMTPYNLNNPLHSGFKAQWQNSDKLRRNFKELIGGWFEEKRNELNPDDLTPTDTLYYFYYLLAGYKDPKDLDEFDKIILTKAEGANIVNHRNIQTEINKEFEKSRLRFRDPDRLAKIEAAAAFFASMNAGAAAAVAAGAVGVRLKHTDPFIRSAIESISTMKAEAPVAKNGGRRNRKSRNRRRRHHKNKTRHLK